MNCKANKQLQFQYKKIRKISFFFFSLFFFTTSVLAKTIVLGTTEWPPYVQNKANKGYAYEIVLAAFKQAGYDNVKIIFMPWTDAEKAAEEGTLDGIFPEYFSKARAEKLVFTHYFSDSPIGFYKKLSGGIHYPNKHPEKNVPATLDGMKQYRFGVVKSYVNLSVFDNDTKLNKIYVNSDVENLKQLYNGKVDLIVIDKYTAEHLLTHSVHELSPDYHEQLVFMNPPLGYKKLYVSISKKNPNAEKIVADFNQGLKEIRENGIFTQIIDRDADRADEHIG